MQRAPDATSLTRNNNIRLAQTLRTATRNHTTFRDSSRYFILRRPVHFVGRCVARKASYDEVVPVGPAGTSTSYCPTLSFREHLIVTRRYALIVIASSSALLACRAPAEASKLPFLDAGWEALGGGPADLVFPEDFLGVWAVTSVLTRVETPLGDDAVPNLAAVRRAQREDLDRPTSYQVDFVRNSAGKVVYDRRFNTASMLSMYYDNTMSFTERIAWNIDDPNVLTVAMPGMLVRTRVTRRSEEFPQQDRIETSEYVESVFDSGDDAAPRIKASQCFTKYKWRSAEAALREKGPAIVATQVVADFLTPYDGDQQYLKAINKPYAQYTYRMTFRRPPSTTQG